MIVPNRWNRKDPVTGQLEPIFFTEGEKKALKGAQEGLLIIGLGGVANWHNHTFSVPWEDIKRSKDQKRAIIPQDVEEQIKDGVCPEFKNIVWSKRRVYIVFDSDSVFNENVQSEAFEFAMFLYEAGADPCQVFLPRRSTEKVGLDDFLISEGIAAFRRLLPDAEFPFHPDIHKYIQKALNAGSKRQTNKRVSRAVVAGMDHSGVRYADKDRHHYYFDNRTRKLHDFTLEPSDVHQFRNNGFGDIVIKEFGVQSPDTAALGFLADDYAHIGPPEVISPRRIVYATNVNNRDTLYYQLGDSSFARVTADSVTFVPNGTDGVLFMSDRTDPLDEDKIEEAVANYPRPRNLWLDALQDFDVVSLPGMDGNESRLFLAALFHLNPWLKRWRGLLLPFELAIAEPNSGKTFLYNLRRGILTGNASLDNVPQDMRSFHAQAKEAPGIWVCDNLGDINRNIREEFSDEAARLITDPDPHSKTRKLFTTAGTEKIPIDCTFAATAIRNPFWKPDILQRAIIFHLNAIPAGKRDSGWYLRRLEHRPEWVAEHLTVVKRFFQLTRTQWQPNYLSGHRLTHFEQSMRLMISALGYPEVAQSVVPKIQDMVQTTIATQDPSMEALKAFADEWFDDYQREYATATDIVDWVKGDLNGRFMHLKTLHNPNAVGRYFTSHVYDIEHSAGLRRIEVDGAPMIKRTAPHITPNGRIQT